MPAVAGVPWVRPTHAGCKKGWKVDASKLETHGESLSRMSCSVLASMWFKADCSPIEALGKANMCGLLLLLNGVPVDLSPHAAQGAACHPLMVCCMGLQIAHYKIFMPFSQPAYFGLTQFAHATAGKPCYGIRDTLSHARQGQAQLQ